MFIDRSQPKASKIFAMSLRICRFVSFFSEIVLFPCLSLKWKTSESGFHTVTSVFTLCVFCRNSESSLALRFSGRNDKVIRGSLHVHFLRSNCRFFNVLIKRAWNCFASCLLGAPARMSPTKKSRWIAFQVSLRYFLNFFGSPKIERIAWFEELATGYLTLVIRYVWTLWLGQNYQRSLW